MRKRAKDRRDRRLQGRPADAVACRLRQAGRAVRYHRRRSAPASASPSRGRETEFCGQRLAGDFSRRMRENGRNSVRRPRHASLTDRNCENFLPTRKPRRFAGTAWWRSQSRQTGLRDRVRLGNREKHTVWQLMPFFGVQKWRGLRFSERLNTRHYNVLADPEPNRAKQNNCQKNCQKNRQTANDSQ